MLIAQISDLHLHADPDHPNHARLAALLGHLRTLVPAPDLLVLSGDLADDGAVASYRHLAGALEGWPAPVHLMAGNHDDRSNMEAVFPGVLGSGGFVQSMVSMDGLRLLLLDTVEPGRGGGAFCAVRAKWLRERLAEAPDVPALLFLHHPPADIGLDWIDPGPRASWTSLLAEAIRDFPIVALCAGHVHAAAVMAWEGHRLIVCPSSSSDLSLNFSVMEGCVPDGRPLVERSQPAFALHRWAGGQLSSYFSRCPAHILARWDETHRAMVESMLAERAA